jgi:hypothetical protein
MVPIEEEEESSKIYVEEFVEKRLGIFTKRANANIKSWKELYGLTVALKKYRCGLLVDEDELVKIT